MTRLIGRLGLILAAFLLMGGIYTLYVFEKDPEGYAIESCPAPPDGVDSAERQACFRDYKQKSGLDVASRWLLGALVFGIGGATAAVTGKDDDEAWSPPG